MATADLLTALPGLGALPNPHLLVLGEWRGDVARVFAHRLAQEDGAGLVAISRREAADIASARTVDGRELDLLAGLAAGNDGLASLRGMLLDLAAVECGPAVPPAVAACLERLAHAGAGAVPQPVAGLALLAMRFPPGTAPARAAALIDDMVGHAAASGLPPPQARRGPWTREDARAAKLALERGELAPDGFALLVAARDAEDWRPYAAELVPDLSPGALAAERDLALVRLRRQAEYRAAPDDALRALAAHALEARIWEIAWSRALEAQATPLPLGSENVLHALDEEPAARPLAGLLRGILGGRTRLPNWWDGGRWLVGDPGRHPLRLAVLLDALLERAALPAVVGRRKVLMVDGEAALAAPAPRAALERLLRGGRKHHLSVVLLLGDQEPPTGAIGELCGNRLVDARSVDRLPARLRPAADLDRAPPRGWWTTSQSPHPAPLGAWFTSDEVASGDRLLTGARA
jgi:hypothetical protein